MQKTINFILLLVICTYSCRNIDPCIEIDCGEFGICLSGKCECFYGTTGRFCHTFSPLQLDSLVLYMDANTMSIDWEPNQEFGWRPDVFIHLYSDTFSTDDCGDSELILSQFYNADIEDIPLSWSPDLRLNERNYTLKVQENDVLQCPKEMASFRFFIDRNANNPLIVVNNTHPDQLVELHWSWQ